MEKPKPKINRQSTFAKVVRGLCMFCDSPETLPVPIGHGNLRGYLWICEKHEKEKSKRGRISEVNQIMEIWRFKLPSYSLQEAAFYQLGREAIQSIAVYGQTYGLVRLNEKRDPNCPATVFMIDYDNEHFGWSFVYDWNFISPRHQRKIQKILDEEESRIIFRGSTVNEPLAMDASPKKLKPKRS